MIACATALDVCFCAAPPPVVTGISPAQGDAGGGTVVTITGAGFSGARGATVGGVALSGFHVVSDTVITGVTGAHAAGVVAAAVGASSLASAFTYLPSSPDFWARADLGVTLNGSNVSAWADQSAAGVMAAVTQGTAMRQPAWVASGIGGNADIVYDGTRGLTGTSARLSGVNAVSLALTFSSSSAAQQFLWGHQYNAYAYQLTLAVGAGSQSAGAGQIGWLGPNAANVVSPLTYNDGQPHAVVATYDNLGAGFALYVDNGVTPVATGTAAGTIPSNGDLNVVGCQTDGNAPGRFLVGHLPEVWAWPRALTAPEIAVLMAYLKTRAGI